jgi:hypothetical protein
MSTGPISFQSSIVPVFVGQNQADPTHEGTAFLLRANGSLFLISAAHVLERFEAGEIWIPVNGVLHNLTGRICRCQENQSSRDNIDVAVVLVDDPAGRSPYSHDCLLSSYDPVKSPMRL